MAMDYLLGKSDKWMTCEDLDLSLFDEFQKVWTQYSVYSIFRLCTKSKEQLDEVKDFVQLQAGSEYELPLFASKVAAGFPSPADDFMDTKLDLNSHLIKTPSATFFVRVSGESMIKAGIHDGDLLVVDRSLEPQVGKIVIAAIQHELTVKRYAKIDGKVYLAPENDAYEPILVNEEDEVHIWGVVTNVIHAV